MQGVFLVHRKRKMVASTVREFLLNEELLLEHVQQLAAELDRSKADTKTCLDLCSMLCTKFKGPLLNSFRTLCLCALQRSWPGLQESGIYDFLHKDFTDFILDISSTVLKRESEEDIIIVMNQTFVDRERAVAALKLHKDAVDAVLAIEDENDAAPMNTADNIRSIMESPSKVLDAQEAY